MRQRGRATRGDGSGMATPTQGHGHSAPCVAVTIPDPLAGRRPAPRCPWRAQALAISRALAISALYLGDLRSLPWTLGVGSWTLGVQNGGVHETFMAAALEQARLALAAGEVPIGALVVADGTIVARSFNQPISACDPTAHAEVVALRAAAAYAGNYRLTGMTLYVTVEPCLMCVGALVHARVREVVYGAAEPKSGALVSTVRAHELPGLNHRLLATGGVLEEECRALIQQFFRARRGRE